MRSTRVERKKLRRKSNSGLKKESGRWRPTTRRVFWAIGMVVTLITIALLVVQLYPPLWEAVSREPVALLKGRVATLIGIGVALTVLIVLLAKGSASLGWTGFRGKTLWDLLQLLIVPLVLVGIGFLFEMQQAEREERRARAERNLAEQRAQDEALQAYLDEMGSLLLAKDGLRESKERSEERTLARARTLTVLGRLDPGRKTALIQFLVEANLIQSVEGKAPIITLSGANLIKADLSEANLLGADLSEANLHDANLHDANLHDANLHNANLIEANLRDADLSDADLSDADLIEANLIEANLVENASVKLSDANLSGDLSDAILSGDLSDANLIEANLLGADLSEAILTGTHGVTKKKLEQQIEQQAKLLRGATMPNGTFLSGAFEPALAISLSDGWQLGEEFGVQEMPDMLFIGDPGERASLKFTSPVHVFDPSNPSEPKEVAAPDNADGWASWFQKHPNLDTISKPYPMSVGGKSGVRIDVTSTPENSSAVYCGGVPCVYLFPAGGSNIVSYVGTKDRFVIVDDVEGKTVVIHISVPAGKFDEFLPKAQKVLESVEWIGG
jgi:uncharacterized protein YjbI with pentapeptide repeats